MFRKVLKKHKVGEDGVMWGRVWNEDQTMAKRDRERVANAVENNQRTVEEPLREGREQSKNL
jgi:hypothetical protein